MYAYNNVPKSHLNLNVYTIWILSILICLFSFNIKFQKKTQFFINKRHVEHTKI